MQLYGLRVSPFVRKVLLYAAEKGLTLDVIPAGMGRGGPAFEALSPFGKVPAFTDGDFGISDSTAIITYLEAKYPTPPLIPATPADRARTIWFEEFADTILVPVIGKIFFNRVIAAMIGMPGDLAAADAAEADELPPLLDYLERNLADVTYLVADAFSLADIAVTSPMQNLAYCTAGVSIEHYPRLFNYLKTIRERTAYAAVLEIEQKERSGFTSAAATI